MNRVEYDAGSMKTSPADVIPYLLHSLFSERGLMDAYVLVFFEKKREHKSEE